MAKADHLGDHITLQLATHGRTATHIDVLPVCLTDAGLTNASLNMTAGEAAAAAAAAAVHPVQCWRSPGARLLSRSAAVRRVFPAGPGGAGAGLGAQGKGPCAL